ncbi:MAG: hypothetical protein KBS68_05930 [Clostridiales bacterium]|nr:hypothetical protein [Candidatus Crickella merdequi]
MYREAVKNRGCLERKRQQVMRQLSRLPKGKFKCHKSAGTYKWYKVVKTGEGTKHIYISRKNRKYAEGLAQRAYLELVLDDIDHELEAVDRYLRYHRQEEKAMQFANRNDGYLELIAPLFGRDDDRGWMDKYVRLNFNNHNKVHKGLDGEFYRSKTEAAIASRLFEKGIAFVYEGGVRLDCGRIVYPDFIIKHPKTGGIYIWEHFGMMDRERYREDNMKKLGEYTQSGYLLNRNLIVTMENDNMHLDMEEIDRIIDYFFLAG